MTSRTLWSAFPRQSPSSFILLSISLEADPACREPARLIAFVAGFVDLMDVLLVIAFTSTFLMIPSIDLYYGRLSSCRLLQNLQNTGPKSTSDGRPCRMRLVGGACSLERTSLCSRFPV